MLPRIERDARHDLIGDLASEIFKRGLFGRDHRIFGRHHVDARIRSRGRVEQDGLVRGIDQLEAGAQRPPFARDRIVRPDTETGDLIVELDIEMVTRRAMTVRAEAIDQRIAHQPAMLTRDRPINYLHWLASDDTHILIEGGPVDYFLFHPDGRAEKLTLGTDLANGERPVIPVPGGCWKALRLHDGARYALMANTLSPEFTPDRVTIGEGAPWMKRYAGKAPWATETALRQLIGPNWK